jgi:hypothetical protein
MRGTNDDSSPRERAILKEPYKTLCHLVTANLVLAALLSGWLLILEKTSPDGPVPRDALTAMADPE